MRNIILLLSILLVSCSNDDEQDYSNCIENSTVENGFIYECNTYNTQIGRMNINYTTEFQTTSCMLEFVNEEYSDYSFEEGDSNINIVNIWISIPSEYYQLQELPEGTYDLREEYDDDPNTLDIVTLFRVGLNVSIYRQENSDNLLISGLILGQPDIYEQAEVTIVKLPSGEYEIEYIFEAEGKIVKGHFKGILSFVDNWS